LKDKSALAGSLIAGLLASICCIGPPVLGAAGLGSLGLASALAPVRPWFLGLTAVLIAVGFYLAYRPQRAEACAPGDACATPVSRRGQRVALWCVTSLALAVATYPSWASRLARPSPVLPPVAAATRLVPLGVEGMTCAACAGEIERELVQVPGVVSARVSFEQKRADVQVTGAAVKADILIAAVQRSGYRARAERPR
jgi:mercuric ion transport protein